MLTLSHSCSQNFWKGSLLFPLVSVQLQVLPFLSIVFGVFMRAAQPLIAYRLAPFKLLIDRPQLAQKDIELSTNLGSTCRLNPQISPYWRYPNFVDRHSQTFLWDSLSALRSSCQSRLLEHLSRISPYYFHALLESSKCATVLPPSFPSIGLQLKLLFVIGNIYEWQSK